MDIKCVSDLPGVGCAFLSSTFHTQPGERPSLANNTRITTPHFLVRSHSMSEDTPCDALCLVFRVSNESETLDDFLRGVPEIQREIFQEWEVSPEKARLSSNAIDAGFKVRTKHRI